MQKFVYLLILAALYNTQTCVQGCLRCKSSVANSTIKQCFLCDQWGKYYMNKEGVCVQSDFQNCQWIDFNGGCLTCKSGAYLDPSTSKCVIVLQVIPKCLVYNSSTNCEYCEKNYLLQSNVCVEIVNKIDNCIEYKSQTFCRNCDIGYYLSDDQKTCLQYPTNQNCFNFTRFKCKTCKSSFVLNQNLYLKKINYDTVFLPGISLSLIQQNSLLSIIQNEDVCEPGLVPNCLIHETANKCKQCQSNYFLDIDGSKCIAYPIDQIENCQYYSAYNQCVACKQGFYRKSITECVANDTSVQNCALFSITSTSTDCVECKTGFYEESNNLCKSRVNYPITNCKTYLSNSDGCATCNDSYVRSQSGKTCLALPTNCDSVSSFSDTATQADLTCTHCVNGYFLDNGCQKGTQQNCEVYEDTQNVCKICNNQYYKPPTCEFKHVDIASCVIYSQSEQKKCNQCSNLKVNVDVEAKCVDQAIISNCKIYLSTDYTKCDQCADNYRLTVNKTCELIGNNCKIWDDNNAQCSSCQNGYSFVTETNATKPTCTSPFNYQVANCEQIATGTTTELVNLTCNVCKENSYYNNIGGYCIEKSKLSQSPIKASANLITNCIKYLRDGNDVKCALCDKNYFLSSDLLTCIDNKCQGNSSTKVPFYPILSGEDLTSLCKTAQGNDWVFAFDVQNDNEIVIECTKYIRVVTILTDDFNYSNINPNGSTFNWINHPLDVTPKLTCIEFDNGNQTINGVAATENSATCQYYYDNNQLNDYFCLNCGSKKAGTPNASGVQLDSCSVINDCVHEDFKNIHVFWKKLLTCHQCTTGVPIITYTSDQNEVSFISFKKFNLTDWTSTTNPTKNVFCLDVTNLTTIKNTLGLNNNLNVRVLSSHCAFAFLNTHYDQTTFDNRSAETDNIQETSLICGACKPGFKPKNTLFDGRAVSQCEKIDECSSNDNNLFNACGKCNENFTHGYSNDKIQWDVCVPIGDKLKNCTAYSMQDQQCIICDVGYNLNQDFYCEKITVPNCEMSNGSNNFISDLSWRYYVLQYGSYDCNKCSSEYVAFFGNVETCVQTDFLTSSKLTFDKKTTGSVTNYINYCSQYKANQLCAKCKADYILEFSQEHCYPQTQIVNCNIALNSTTCKICNEGFSLVNDKCVANNIENCKVFNQFSSSNTVECNTCNDGFWLSQDLKSCNQGYLQNCKTYAGEESCIECVTGYWLLFEQNEFSSKYCIQSVSDVNCLQPYFRIDQDRLILHCDSDQCPQSYSKQLIYDLGTNKVDVLTICMNLNPITECKTYSNVQDLSGYSFICSECNDGFYLNNHQTTCTKRTALTTNCQVFYIDADKCSSCKDGTFLSASETECLLVPDGIVGCRMYTNKNTCTACVAQRYLENNKCILVEVADRLTGCVYYKSKTTCQVCESNYFLNTDGKCEISTVTNCVQYSAVDACQVCANGYVIELVNAKRNCKLSDLQNCTIIDQENNKCTQCNQNFYVSTEGLCVIVNPIITSCLINESLTKCKLCDDTKALSNDQTKCLNKQDFDYNCEEQIQTPNLICSSCKAGYYFNGDACTQNALTGCHLFYPSTLSVCEVCKTGYFMNPQGICQQNIDEGKNTNTNGLKALNNIWILALFLLTWFE